MGILFSISKSVKSPASGKENVRFPDGPDLLDFRTRLMSYFNQIIFIQGKDTKRK